MFSLNKKWISWIFNEKFYLVFFILGFINKKKNRRYFLRKNLSFTQNLLLLEFFFLNKLIEIYICYFLTIIAILFTF